MGELPTLAPAPTTITPARRYLQNRLAYRKGSHAPGVANAARTRRCVEATRRLCSNFALASPLASPNFVRNPEFNRSHRCGEKKIRPAYSIVRAQSTSQAIDVLKLQLMQSAGPDLQIVVGTDLQMGGTDLQMRIDTFMRN